MHQDDDLHDERDADADPRAVEQAAQQVATELVGPEDVSGRPGGSGPPPPAKTALRSCCVVRVRREQRPEDAEEEQAR